VAEKAYGYRLWKERSGSMIGRVLAPKLVVSDTTDWFDLGDRAATLDALDALVAKHAGGHADPAEFWLEILDPATGAFLTKVVPREPALATVGANGTARRRSSMPYSQPSLEDVSDEALIRELLRRLKGR
jgi:hypothetical protein